MQQNVNHSTALDAVTLYLGRYNSLRLQKIIGNSVLLVLAGLLTIYLIFGIVTYLRDYQSEEGWQTQHKMDRRTGTYSQTRMGSGMALIFKIGLPGVFMLLFFALASKNSSWVSNKLSSYENVKFADYGNPEEVAINIKADLMGGSKQIGPFYFGSEWMVLSFPLDVWLYDDLVWVYYDSIDKKALMIKSVEHTESKIEMTDVAAQLIISEIKMHSPWIKTDADETLLKQWNRIKRWSDERRIFRDNIRNQ